MTGKYYDWESFSFQASSRMHRDHRSRSRSASAVNRFLRVRAERRGGKSYKRRFKSACLSLLTYFIELLHWVQPNLREAMDEEDLASFPHRSGDVWGAICNPYRGSAN